MNETFDVAIVGAGPAGISAAITLANAGIKTVVVERGEYPGAKNMSGGVLYGHDLGQILPDFTKIPGFPIERNIIESRIWYLSKEAGISVGYRDSIFAGERKQNVFTVGRAKFDRWYADQARKKGALIVPATVVLDLIRENGRVTGVQTGRADGDIHAKVVLIADGVNSRLAVTAGFRPDVKPEHVALAVKEVIELAPEIIDQRFGVSDGNGVTTEILGAVAGGMDGVGVLYTNKASISLALGANLADFSKTKLKPYDLIETFKKHPMVAPLIAGGKSLEYTAHWLPEGGYDTMPKLYGDGYLIAGDSAMLFNAPHREGSNLAMLSGKMAADTIIEAMKTGDFSAKSLSAYNTKLSESKILQDMKKYRGFGGFLYDHKEIFETMPEIVQFGGRELLTVNAESKKTKQDKIIKKLRKDMGIPRFVRLMWSGFRAVK